MEIVEEDVVIVGAGIAGLATAVALKRVGIRALVLEKSQRLRSTGAALGLSPNAWLALNALGVSHKLTSIYAPFLKVTITDVSNGAVQQAFLNNGDKGPGTRQVHRKALLEALAQELPTDSIRFSSKLASIVQEQDQAGASIAVVHLEDGTRIKSKVLIGCDGVHSVVARWLGLAEPVHSGRSAVRGLAVFPHGHGFEQQELRQFVDVGKRTGFGPLNDKEIYWAGSFQSPPKGEILPADPEQIQRAVIEKYTENFPTVFLDVVMHSDISTLTWAPLMLRHPWSIIFGNLSKGNVTVAGDAMHPMTPDLAQGGCSALEDAVVLGRNIGISIIKNGGLIPADVARAIDDYARERRWRAALLVTGSFLSGWVQQDGAKWWMKFLRDGVFYKYLYGRISRLVHYDCGKLPTIGKTDHSSKKED